MTKKKGKHFFFFINRSAIEWESEISASGEVFYIESLVKTTTSTTNDESTKIDKLNKKSILLPKSELTRRRSTRAGKLIRLIKRKESYRHSVRLSGLASEFKKNHESISNRLYKERQQLKFKSNDHDLIVNDDFNKGEKYVVNLTIVTEDNRHKFGRRATLCEIYLGIVPKLGSDKLKIFIGDLIPDGEAFKNKDIKIGDWLRSIDSKDVDCHNIDQVLSNVATLTSVSFSSFFFKF